MDRLTSQEIDPARIAYWRAYHHDNSAAEDTELDPLDRRDRADVIVPSYLKRDDDIEIGVIGGVKTRIVGPGPGRYMALIYYPEWFGDEAIPLQLNPGDVTDRAPANTEEDPMPCWPEPEGE
jgi:hypothetical protein